MQHQWLSPLNVLLFSGIEVNLKKWKMSVFFIAIAFQGCVNIRSMCCSILCQNNIPVFSPALTDGSLGDMLYFHSYKSPGLILDIVEGKIIIETTNGPARVVWALSVCHIVHVHIVSDIRKLNSQAVRAKRTGMIILGGGLVKHHISNANLMVTDLHGALPY